MLMGSIAGVYLHIPFCASRCHYCNFATGGYEEYLAERYVSALIDEVRSVQPEGSRAHMRRVDTVYFGGGTPTTLSVEQLDRILRAVKTSLDVVPETEVTIEANPGAVTQSYLGQLREKGFDRLSFGVQSFDDSELAMIGRTHNSDDARESVALARLSGFDNVSIDLIAGLPEQRMETWSRNLDAAFALSPDHLSVYLLELYKDAPLEHRIKRGELARIDDDLTAAMYFALLDRARVCGFEHYEISNWARPGKFSRHNLKYWTGAPYWAFGVSASGYDGHERWSNTRNLIEYCSLIESRQSPVDESVTVDDEDRQSEAIFLNLRLESGVNLDDHFARFGVNVLERYESELDRLSAAGLIELEGGRMRISRRGKILANEVFAAFI
jgi:oxygen-independent coproporphyrinogen-3 oxidase